MDKGKTAVIYLASGNSSRFGKREQTVKVYWDKTDVPLWTRSSDRNLQKTSKLGDRRCNPA